jgi:hypothetical protein
VDEILAQPQQQLEATDAIDMGLNTAFGEAVAIDGNMMVVGSPHESYLSDREGAIYVFERIDAMWSQTQRIVSPDGDVRGQFGTGVDISLGTEGISFIVVGAPFAGASGKVYTFKKDGGGLFEYDDTLLLFEPDSAAQFGVDVGIDFFIPPTSQTGDPAFVVAVGAPGDRESIPAGNNHGSASIFQYVGSPQSWTNTDIFYGANGGRMGTSVAVAGPAIVAGSIGDGNAAFGGGAAFLYTQGNQLPVGAFTYNPGPRLEVDQALTGEGLGNASAADWESGLAAVGG